MVHTLTPLWGVQLVEIGDLGKGCEGSKQDGVHIGADNIEVEYMK